MLRPLSSPLGDQEAPGTAPAVGIYQDGLAYKVLPLHLGEQEPHGQGKGPIPKVQTLPSRALPPSPPSLWPVTLPAGKHSLDPGLGQPGLPLLCCQSEDGL